MLGHAGRAVPDLGPKRVGCAEETRSAKRFTASRGDLGCVDQALERPFLVSQPAGEAQGVGQEGCGFVDLAFVEGQRG